MTPKLLVAALVALGAATGATAQAPRTYDRVILRGRVMDPASKLDAVRNLGILDGRIAAISAGPLRGRDTVDAKGLVVSPGFVDLHAHGQNDESYGYYALDGVTTALELETGIGPVARFYAERAGKARVNYGGAASHFQARRVALGDTLIPYEQRLTDTSTRWSHTPSTAATIATVRTELARALDEGALGIGMGVAYVPGASAVEILRNFELCAERRVVCFTHVRGAGAGVGGLIGLQEVLTDAMVTGAALHVVHINSSSGANAGSPDAPDFLRAIHQARAHGIDVTTEAYPYTASSTLLQSSLYDRALDTPNYDFGRIVWAANGEHLTRESFIKYRKQGGVIVQIGGADANLYPIFRDSIVMVASDAVQYVEHRGNPRLAGTFARVLGRLSREQRLFPLMEALRRMTIMPAERLQRMVPSMARKGRIKVGADADLTIFDPATVIDRATVEEPAQYSVGIVHVLVGGISVVRGAKLVEGVFPGQPVRRASTLAALTPAAAQSTPDHALAHPIFRQYYSCGEHAAGELKYQGDDLGTDCVIAKLVEIDGRNWVRAYQGTGERNEDWFGWRQDVLAPCTCEVVKVSLNPEVNLPGILGKPPASIIVFRRDDDVHFILAHVAEVTVAAGQRVQAGEKVAVVGNNGMSRSPHIHVGAWKGSQALQIRFDLTALGAIRRQN